MIEIEKLLSNSLEIANHAKISIFSTTENNFANELTTLTVPMIYYINLKCSMLWMGDSEQSKRNSRSRNHFSNV